MRVVLSEEVRSRPRTSSLLSTSIAPQHGGMQNSPRNSINFTIKYYPKNLYFSKEPMPETIWSALHFSVSKLVEKLPRRLMGQ